MRASERHRRDQSFAALMFVPRQSKVEWWTEFGVFAVLCVIAAALFSFPGWK